MLIRRLFINTTPSRASLYVWLVLISIHLRPLTVAFRLLRTFQVHTEGPAPYVNKGCLFRRSRCPAYAILHLRQYLFYVVHRVLCFLRINYVLLSNITTLRSLFGLLSEDTFECLLATCFGGSISCGNGRIVRGIDSQKEKVCHVTQWMLGSWWFIYKTSKNLFDNTQSTIKKLKWDVLQKNILVQMKSIAVNVSGRLRVCFPRSPAYLLTPIRASTRWSKWADNQLYSWSIFWKWMNGNEKQWLGLTAQSECECVFQINLMIWFT